MKRSWRPSWEREGRLPSYVGNNIPPFIPFGRSKFLWGNVPALDIIRLKDDEGVAYNKHMNLLFAASGDLRNVVKTIISLPKGFSGGLSVDINDRDMDIVARNIIFLLLFYTIEDAEEAAECVLHLWYSALIPQACLQTLGRLGDIIGDVCSKIKSKPDHAMLGKTWTFAQGKGSLRVLLAKGMWDSAVVPYGPGRTDSGARRTSSIFNNECATTD